MTHDRIDPEFKARWIAALESGKYKKGKSCLRSHNNRYCCLGVAGDLLRPGKWVRSHVYSLEDETVCLPSELSAEIGLSSDAEIHLMNLNDDSDTFKPVVAWIEENL